MTYTEGRLPGQEFQSLFSWNLLLMSRSRTPSSMPWICFNPCFRGTCSWWFAFILILTHLFVSILVFVELALDDPRLHNRWSTSSRVSILVFVELALDGCPASVYNPGPWFQSLFSWNLLLMIALCMAWEQIIVSILVFVELALDVHGWKTAPGKHSSFNPCFRGTCSWCGGPQCRQLFEHLVSILVFVELALDACKNANGCYIIT